ncbi:MAG: hypothetical protein ACK5TH_09410, partial [Prosthecobacter sp.]
MKSNHALLFALAASLLTSCGDKAKPSQAAAPAPAAEKPAAAPTPAPVTPAKDEPKKVYWTPEMMHTEV